MTWIGIFGPESNRILFNCCAVIYIPWFHSQETAPRIYEDSIGNFFLIDPVGRKELHIPGPKSDAGCSDWMIFKKNICGETKYFLGSRDDSGIKHRDCAVLLQGRKAKSIDHPDRLAFLQKSKEEKKDGADDRLTELKAQILAKKRKQAEEEAKRLKQAEAEAKKIKEEEAKKIQEAEEEAKKVKEAEEEAKKVKEAEEEAKKVKEAEEEAQKVKEAEEAALRKQAEAEAEKEFEEEQKAKRRKLELENKDNMDVEEDTNPVATSAAASVPTPEALPLAPQAERNRQVDGDDLT